MGVNYNTSIVTDGLVDCLDTSVFDNTSSHVVKSRASNSTFTINNFSSFKTYGDIVVLNSNVLSDGSGNSHVLLSRNQALETGSITFIIWFNRNNIPLNVGGNNNWRGLLATANSGTAGSPLTMVLEQSSLINFSTTHTDLYRRLLNNDFSPVSCNTNGWQMITYTYNSNSGIASCYKNDIMIRSGPMTEANGANPTQPGTLLSYTNYQNSGFRIYGGTNSAANPVGNAYCPGYLGNIYIYNRSITLQEVRQNFNALRGRYEV